MRQPRTQADAMLVRARGILASHRQRAKKHGQSLDYGLIELLTLIRVNPQCAYCKMPLSFAFEIDHELPTSRGGAHALWNLCVACERCNRLKCGLSRPEFEELRELLESLHPAARQDIETRLLMGWKGVRAG